MIKRKNFKIIGSQQVGFSLIEILVVMVMMATLIGLVANSVGNSRKKGQIQEAKIRIGQLKLKIEEFNLDLGYYPNSLEALVSDNGDGNWMGPYVKDRELKDSWGQKIQYSNPGQHDEDFNLVSYGVDKAAGGSKFDKDINSWDL
ncbi:MAG: type II secretion system protein GspG [Proteobacteria bacterium]|nr:type II secretion system protein GspG [Pseudomonadota bacterium]